MALESLEKGTLSTWGGDVKRWMPNVCGGTPILPPIAPSTIISFCKGFQIRNTKKKLAARANKNSALHRCVQAGKH